MNTELIAETWDSLAHRHIDVIETFYARFFERFPHYREMFPAKMDQQMKKMVRTMAMVARLSDDEPIIGPHLAKVGDRHRPYSLQAQDLENFKAVFLELIAEECGSRWTEQHAQAWNDAFDEVIIPLMLKGLVGEDIGQDASLGIAPG
jgi:hemoglobin-like flavoprotein